MKEALNKLNKDQQKAVITTSGPLLILAGAGSGKTKVLTFRIYYLLAKNLAKPENILAVTFTNKAANEMKERIFSLLDTSEQNIPKLYWVGTFHSICVKILRNHAEKLGYSSLFSIYDKTDQLETIKSVMKNLELDNKNLRPNAVLSSISSAKSEGINEKDYQKYYSGFFQSQVAKIYPEYQKILKSNSAMDFDDLIINTVQLFKKFPEVLNMYQELFTHIFVDEYQDTNKTQYLLIKMLSEKHKNICVVGDDAQSIYSFRGATIENILNFEKDYPNAVIVKLEQNYRSTKTILNASNNIISKNIRQKEKKLWTANSSGEKITLYEAEDESDEANWVTKKILELNKSDIAVLYRTNAQSRILEEYFLKAGIPYTVVGSIEFYKRKEIKDMLAYVRIILNINDFSALKRIINYPRRGIGASTIKKIEISSFSSNKDFLTYLVELEKSELESWGKSVFEFISLYKTLVSLATKESIDVLLKSIFTLSGYEELLRDETSENIQRKENILELISVAQKYKDYPPKEGASQFIEDISLIESYNQQTNQDTVKLLTVHSAKGLEFDYLFLVGMEEGIFPHANSYYDPYQMEEERRLAYVAVTRAKIKLFIVNAISRTLYGSRNSNPISRFISDIPESLLEIENHYENTNSFNVPFKEVKEKVIDLKKGQQVRHDLFGIGSVIDFDDSVVVIDFNGKKRQFIRDYAKLEIV